MSDERYCPKCGLEWPNFCPLDGQKLSGPWTCSNVHREAPARPVSEPAAEAKPAVKRRLGTPWGRRGRRRREDREAARTVVDAQAVQASAVLERLRAEQAAPRADADASRIARTVVQRALDAAEIERPESPAKHPAKSTSAQPKRSAPRGGRADRRPEFSDTQWFMKGLDVQDLADPKTGEVAVDDEEYLRDDSISEEERRKFTLRKRGEE